MINMIKTGCQLVRVCKTLSLFLFSNVVSVCYVVKSDRLLELITSIRKNMKPRLLTLMDKILLRKRSIIETINDQLKNISQLEHSRHRSCNNFMVNFYNC